jgi:hypothetical protein
MSNESKKDFLLGCITGQLCELMNNIKTASLTVDQIYESLEDITRGAAIMINEIYSRKEAKND